MKACILHNLFLVMLLSLFYYFPIQAQDFEALLKAEKKIRINGGISVEQLFYSSSGLTSRREPYNYFINGNLNISFLQWSVPFSFSFTNQVFSYQTRSPFNFNQFSMQPTYKWIKLYIGYNSMNFSSYTMNGHIFLGGGVELTPQGHWAFSAMYGRFRKAVPYQDDLRNIPYFQRIGYGIKFRYNFNKKIIPKNSQLIESKYDKDGEEIPFKEVEKLPEKEVSGGVELIVFAGKDDSKSIARLPDSLKIFPEQNLALSLHLNTKIFQKIGIDVEIANSNLTRNIAVLEDSLKGQTPWYTPRLIPINSTTAFYTAFKAILNYQAEFWNIGGQIERVDPGYRTHGAYYFNNDIESIALTGGVQLLNKKLSLNGSFGTQRNNLDGNKFSGTNRASWALNVAYSMTQRLALNLSYSNFQTITKIRPVLNIANQINTFDNLDTLNYTQISQNYQGNLMWVVKQSEQNRQSWNNSLSYQIATDNQQNRQEGRQNAVFYNYNSSYTIQWKPLSLSLVFNYNQTENNGFKTQIGGPSAVVNTGFFQKKLKSSFAASLNQAYTNGTQISNILNLRLSNQFVYQEKHNFQFNLIFLNRNMAAAGVQTTSASTSANTFNEFTATLMYQYSF